MIFFQSIFLWAIAAVAVPVAIALWNLKKKRHENFGAFYLLRRFSESSQKRIRLLELLKLLNRIALFILFILVFADPLQNVLRFSEADQGFAIMLDVGRVMQAADRLGKTLIALQHAQLTQVLSQMPSQSQGIVLFVSNHCDSALLKNNRWTASASTWTSELSESHIPYSNAPTTARGFAQCLSRAESSFEGKTVFKIFISPLPDSLGDESLKDGKVRVLKLPEPVVEVAEPVSIQQELKGNQVRVLLNPPTPREAKVIRAASVEPLGLVQSFVDLLAGDSTWLWLSDQKQNSNDPWSGQSFVPLLAQLSSQVVVWTKTETPGYLSLLTALRSHPDLRVIRQVGGDPTGEPLIIYGAYGGNVSSLGRTWFFINPENPSPFESRDRKTWSSAANSLDLQKSFRLKTSSGDIFIKRYVLLDLDRFEPFESFEDGAPALLKNRSARMNQWISPFDLEDLTTDLSLEVTFIPYLYRHLETWLRPASASHAQASTAVWLLPGRLKPLPSVVSQLEWPGIYKSEADTYTVIQPSSFPTKFLSEPKILDTKSTLRNEQVSQRPQIFRWLVLSLFLELLLCLFSARRGLRILGLYVIAALSIESPVHASMGADSSRSISVGIFHGMDSDRKKALTQFLSEASHLSNLDFEEPQEVSMEGLWKNSFLVASGAKFGPFKPEDRERIRDYCERGGLLVFDDPLATSDSPFYSSVVKELAEIFPGRSLSSISKENVLTKTFYLLSEVSGRKLSSPTLEGLEFDKRWVAIFSFNDLLGAILKGSNGDFALPVTPYGISQRILAKRMLLNIAMYSVTLDYKDDAIHLKQILARRQR